MSNDSDKIITHMQARHAARNIRIAEESIREGEQTRQKLEKLQQKEGQILAQHRMITAVMAHLLRKAGSSVTIMMSELEKDSAPNINFEVNKTFNCLTVTLTEPEPKDEEEPAIGELGIDRTTEYCDAMGRNIDPDAPDRVDPDKEPMDHNDEGNEQP